MKTPLILVLSACLIVSAAARTWTDVQGRKIEATLMRVEGANVILRMADGREVPYPLAKLSEEDRKFADANRLPADTKKPDPEKKTEGANFDAPWPDSVKFAEDPEIKTVEEDAEKKSFIYESANYRYFCDVRLSQTVVKGFAVLFEATHQYCRALPLAIDGGAKTDGKYKISLFEKEEDYHRAGGPAGSAGVFIGGKDAVLIPLASLGVKPVGSGYMLDRDKSSSTIPHELTHQLTPDSYFEEGGRGWFTEGIAEYVGATPYRSGTFSVRSNQKPIIDYVTRYGAKDMGGRALGTEIRMMKLKNFMLQDYGSFLETPQISYGCGLLVTFYFLHLDGEGDAKRMKEFLKALRSGKRGEAALELLLDGRTFEKLQEDFKKGWSRKGVEFTFE